MRRQGHAYTRAALWTSVVTFAAAVTWWTPAKSFYGVGLAPEGYFAWAGHVMLLPGSVVALIVYAPFGATAWVGPFDGISRAWLFVWLVEVILYNWLLYFGLFALGMHLRQRVSRV